MDKLPDEVVLAAFRAFWAEPEKPIYALSKEIGIPVWELQRIGWAQDYKHLLMCIPNGSTRVWVGERTLGSPRYDLMNLKRERRGNK